MNKAKCRLPRSGRYILLVDVELCMTLGVYGIYGKEELEQGRRKHRKVTAGLGCWLVTFLIFHGMTGRANGAPFGLGQHGNDDSSRSESSGDWQ